MTQLRTLDLGHNQLTVLPLSKAVVDAASAADLKKITLGVRPESFHVASDAGGTGALQLHVNLVEELGADAYVHGTLPQEDELNAKQFVVRFDGRIPPRIGDLISVEVRRDEEHAFNPDSGERLG